MTQKINGKKINGSKMTQKINGEKNKWVKNDPKNQR